MRVILLCDRHVARHMGRCQPGRATNNWDADTVNTPEGESTWVLQLVYSAFNVQQRARMMALHKLEPPAAFMHSFKLSEQTLAEPEHSLVQCKITQGNSCLKIIWKIQREQLRMSSRRGGSRGHVATQRPVNLPSSSVETTSEQNRNPSRLAGRSNVRGRGEIMDCGHVEHPAVRYRIPCTLANNTLIVSVSVEHCSSLRGQLVDLNVRVVDMQVPLVDMRRPTRADIPSATQTTDASPSEPVQKDFALGLGRIPEAQM